MKNSWLKPFLKISIKTLILILDYQTTTNECDLKYNFPHQLNSILCHNPYMQTKQLTPNPIFVKDSFMFRRKTTWEKVIMLIVK